MRDFFIWIVSVAASFVLGQHFHKKSRPTIENFRQLLISGDWTKSYIDNAEVWLSREDSSFRIEVSNDLTSFDESWTKKYPNKAAKRCPVYLKASGVTLKEITFILLDGGQYFVPMPKVLVDENGEQVFQWEGGSLEILVSKIIGKYHNDKNILDVAKYCGIEITI